jgi:hypothetical protein
MRFQCDFASQSRIKTLYRQFLKRRKTVSKQFWYAFSPLWYSLHCWSAPANQRWRSLRPPLRYRHRPPHPTASPTASPVSTTVPTPEPVWIFQTGAAIWGMPAISNGTVYFGSDDGNLYTVDAQNGSLRWKFLTQGIVRSRPAIVGELVTLPLPRLKNGPSA